MKLSKREIILLTILLIIALFFVEYRFIITPGIERLISLNSKSEDLDNQINEINLNLTIATAMIKKRDSNLVKINELSKPFLDGVTPDSLLVFTHEMLLKHGFKPFNYALSALAAASLNPAQAEVASLTYQIKELARDYRNLQNGKTSSSTDAAPTPTAATGSDSVLEKYSIQINTTGTYDQIKTMLDDFKGLGRSIIISSINMTPYQNGLLAVIFRVDYYGLDKLDESTTVDPINEWKRVSPIQVVVDPYAKPSPEPTTVPTR